MSVLLVAYAGSTTVLHKTLCPRNAQDKRTKMTYTIILSCHVWLDWGTGKWSLGLHGKQYGIKHWSWLTIEPFPEWRRLYRYVLSHLHRYRKISFITVSLVVQTFWCTCITNPKKDYSKLETVNLTERPKSCWSNLKFTLNRTHWLLLELGVCS